MPTESSTEPSLGTTEPGAGPALEARGLTKHFPVRGRGRGSSAGGRQVVRAVEDVSLSLYPGQVTALVGESGSGKSTVARLLSQLYTHTSGTILLKGTPVKARWGRAFRRYTKQVQIIFQDPFSSLNPTRTVRHHLSRPLLIHGQVSRRSEMDDAIADLLREVNLTPPEEFIDKFPHELSGGQRQRISVARALAARPLVLLADEPVSMLDVSIRLGVLNLLRRLATARNLALLYITHDIASARYFATTTLVMYAGQLIEGGPSEAVTQTPAHPYTQLLIASAPDPEHLEEGRTDIGGTGEPPSLINPPSGCRFHPRCPHAMDICVTTDPSTTDLEGGHWVRCWLHNKPADQIPGQAAAG
ncbi:MAG TPA: ABC transporter ATP-binding protein [Acidimicrobiales bacterium]|nr:ABC transporter ATP-binding protein [Acidimicrobiales bacterium]